MTNRETQLETGKKSEILVNRTRSINSSGVQLLRRRDVLKKCRLSKTKLYWLTKAGSAKYDPTFPKGFVIGDDPHNKKPKFWLEAKVDAWILCHQKEVV